MKKNVFFLLLFFAFALSAYAQETFLDAKPKLVSFTLKNGLTVYLNEDHTSPTIYGGLIVKAGSDNEDSTATGIAHYFEHIMFKGTDKIGTTDWSKESVLLDSIRLQYDELGKAKEESVRQAIQMKINSLSVRAAKYAVPNELSQLLQYFGGSALNAYTNFDRTFYHNIFPSNQLQAWLDIYAERFRKPVFRLFQSELETVYEEKNRSSDNLIQQLFEKVNSIVFAGHPAGHHPVLGLSEHLKQPSLTKMNEFYEKYYVASNMALVLCGDFDCQTAAKWIDEKFSVLKKGEPAKVLEAKPRAIHGRTFAQIRVTPVKVGVLVYHTVPKSHPDYLPLQLANAVLSNANATGLLDKLRLDGQLMELGVDPVQLSDLGCLSIFFVPKIIGQTFRRAEKILLNEMGKLRRGEFSDELLASQKIALELQYKRENESLEGQANFILEAFLSGTNTLEASEYQQRIQSITKEEVLAAVRKYYGDDFWMIYSRAGFPKKEKLSKPSFSPVIPQSEITDSEYAKQLKSKPVSDFIPHFIKLGKDVLLSDLKDRVHFYYTPNPYNDVFNLTLRYGQGFQSNKLLPYVADYIQSVGTVSQEGALFRNKLQLLGASCTLVCEEKSFKLSVSGLERDLQAILVLLGDLLQHPQNDPSKIGNIYSRCKTERRIEKAELMSLLRALMRYGLYDAHSNELERLSLSEIKKLKAEQLLDAFQSVQNYELDIHYSGCLGADSVKKMLKTTIRFADKPLKTTRFDYLEHKKYDRSTVLFLNESKARQTNLLLLREGNPVSKLERPAMIALNQYLGDGSSMASILFQEIREYRSLAYSLSGSYMQEMNIPAQAGYTLCYLGTQADKTAEALSVTNHLLDHLPQKTERMESIRNSLIQSINTETPGFRERSFFVQNFREAGYSSDPRKEQYEIYKKLSFDDLIAFYKKNIQNRPSVIAIVGNKKKIEWEKVRALGIVKELKKNEILR